MSLRSVFYRHENSLLLIGYAAAAGMLAGLWDAYGWQWGLIFVSTFVLVHLAFALGRAYVESAGWRDE